MRIGAYRTALLCILLILVSCARAPRTPEYVVPPSAAPIELERSSRSTVALVLGGGALRGFAHVGVIKVLDEHGIRPDLIVGVSAGSFVGTLYAAGYQAEDLERLALGVERKELVDYSLCRCSHRFPDGPAQRLQSRRYRNGSPRFEQHPRLISSCRVDISYAPEQTSISNPLNIPFQTMHIMAQALSAHQIKAADVAIRPKIPGDVSFGNKQAMIRAGEEAATRAPPEIETLLTVGKQSPTQVFASVCPPMKGRITPR